MLYNNIIIYWFELNWIFMLNNSLFELFELYKQILEKHSNKFKHGSSEPDQWPTNQLKRLPQSVSMTHSVCNSGNRKCFRTENKYQFQ